MRPPADLVEDAALLLELAARDPEQELTLARSQVVAWSHGKVNSTPRPLPLDRERGFAPGKITPGLPDVRTKIRVFGLDERGRVVLYEDYGEEGLAWQVSTRFDGELVNRLIVGRGREGDWEVESVGYERWDGDRVQTTASAARAVREVSREDYFYDERGEIDSIVESRTWDELSHRDDYSIAQRRAWTAVRDEDGALEAVLDGSDVAWRRRRPGQGKLRAAAEDALVRDLVTALDGLPGLVLLRHQEDGPWSDQLALEVSATSLESADADWEDRWEPSEWEHPSVEWRQSPATALDELGYPAPGDVRGLLVNVAARLSGRPGAPIVVVTSFDPEDLAHQIASSTSLDRRRTLAAAGWLP